MTTLGALKVMVLEATAEESPNPAIVRVPLADKLSEPVAEANDDALNWTDKLQLVAAQPTDTEVLRSRKTRSMDVSRRAVRRFSTDIVGLQGCVRMHTLRFKGKASPLVDR